MFEKQFLNQTDVTGLKDIKVSKNIANINQIEGINKLESEIDHSVSIPEINRFYYPNALHLNEFTGEDELNQSGSVVILQNFDPKFNY